MGRRWTGARTARGPSSGPDIDAARYTRHVSRCAARPVWTCAREKPRGPTDLHQLSEVHEGRVAGSDRVHDELGGGPAPVLSHLRGLEEDQEKDSVAPPPPLLKERDQRGEAVMVVAPALFLRTMANWNGRHATGSGCR